MVVSSGGAWLAEHLLLLLMLLSQPPLLMTSSLPNDVNDDVSRGQQQAALGMENSVDLTQAYTNNNNSNNNNNNNQDPDRMMGERQGGMGMLADHSGPSTFQIEDIQVGCRELRAKRYISDGFCTSTKPIREVVCAGNCLPIMSLPWYAQFVKVWAQSKVKQWECVEDVVRKKSVHLLCRNGQYRTYRIKVVKSCRCQKTSSRNNRTPRPAGSKKKPKRQKGKKSRKKGKKRRRGERRNRKDEEVLGMGVGGSQVDQRQAGSRDGNTQTLGDREAGSDRERDRENSDDRQAGSDRESDRQAGSDRKTGRQKPDDRQAGSDRNTGRQKPDNRQAGSDRDAKSLDDGQRGSDRKDKKKRR